MGILRRKARLEGPKFFLSFGFGRLNFSFRNCWSSLTCLPADLYSVRGICSNLFHGFHCGNFTLGIRTSLLSLTASAMVPGLVPVAVRSSTSNGFRVNGFAGQFSVLHVVVFFNPSRIQLALFIGCPYKMLCLSVF